MTTASRTLSLVMSVALFGMIAGGCGAPQEEDAAATAELKGGRACKITCPAGQVLDTASCSCKCDLTCPPGQVLDTASCSCKCDLTCPPGESLDTTSCSCYTPVCEPPSPCPAGTAWSFKNCRCETGVDCYGDICVDGAICCRNCAMCAMACPPLCP
jgi:hypothetical protein